MPLRGRLCGSGSGVGDERAQWTGMWEEIGCLTVRRLAGKEHGQIGGLPVWILSLFGCPVIDPNSISGAILRLLNEVIQMLRNGKAVKVKALKYYSVSHCHEILIRHCGGRFTSLGFEWFLN